MRLPTDMPIPLSAGVVMIFILVNQMIIGSGGLVHVSTEMSLHVVLTTGSER